MKVLQVVHNFFPEARSGTEMVVRDLCRGLEGRAQTAVFCMSYYQGTAPFGLTRLEHEGIPVYRVEPPPGRRYRRDTRLDPVFRAVLEDFRPDIVHFHHLWQLSSTLPAGCFAPWDGNRRLPRMLTLHDYHFACPIACLFTSDNVVCEVPPGAACLNCQWPNRDSRLRSKLSPNVLRLLQTAGQAAARTLLPLPVGVIKAEADSWLGESQVLLEEMDLVTAPTAFLFDVLEKRGLRFGRRRLVRNGVDDEPFRQMPPRAAGERLRFGFIGNNLYKGLDLLLEAFGGLGDRAELHLYGDVNLALTPRSRFRAGLPTGVIAHGPFAPRDVANVFAEFDVLIVPSIWLENAPIVVQEAFAAGVPVISAAPSGTAEAITEGKNGLLFPRGDASSLRSVLVELIDTPQRVIALRAGVSFAGQRKEGVAQEMWECYQSLEGNR